MKTVLNVGCGSAQIHSDFKGWAETRLDIDPAVKPDIVCDMRHIPTGLYGLVENEYFDAVYSSHTLEHLYAHEVPMALESFDRVLRPGGAILIGVPNLLEIVHKISRNEYDLEETFYISPAGPVAPIDCIYGYRPFLKAGNTYQGHKTGFTPDTLTAKLSAAGFANITVETNGIDMWASGVKK